MESLLNDEPGRVVVNTHVLDSHAEPFSSPPPAPSVSRRLAAEFLGTFVMMVFGIGVDCQTIFSKAGSCAYALETGAPQVSSDGGELSINLCWGAGVFFGVMIAGGVTGAHLNPAVVSARFGLGSANQQTHPAPYSQIPSLHTPTSRQPTLPRQSVTMALRKELEWSMVLPYFFAQFLGAFVASAVMFLNYSPAMYHYARKCCDGTDSPFYDGCREDTAHAWTSFPQRYESVGYGFADQVGAYLYHRRHR